MSDEASIDRVRDALLRWSAAGASSTEVVDLAARAVADGVETPWVVDLACLPAGASSGDVEDVLRASPPDVAPAVLPRGNTGALVAVAMAQVRRCSTGLLPERDLARWAHEAIGHGRSDELEPLVCLDDSYDIAGYYGDPAEQVDRLVRAEVERLLRSHENS